MPVSATGFIDCWPLPSAGQPGTRFYVWAYRRYYFTPRCRCGTVKCLRYTFESKKTHERSRDRILILLYFIERVVKDDDIHSSRALRSLRMTGDAFEKRKLEVMCKKCECYCEIFRIWMLWKDVRELRVDAVKGCARRVRARRSAHAQIFGGNRASRVKWVESEL